MNTLIATLAIGIGATATMDIWGIARNVILGNKAPDYGMVGRWLGHMANGQFKHDAIVKAPPIYGERALGWTAHYLTGIMFAAVLILTWGSQWVQAPTLLPALAVGLGSVIAPYCLMQPGMGAGFAASKMPNPKAARWQSLLNHFVFGAGLYLSARTMQLISQA